MRTLTYLCGPSCTGKSSLVNEIKKSLSSIHCICGDDYWNMYPSLPFWERVERTNQHVLASVRSSEAPDIVCEWVPWEKGFVDDLYSVAEASGRRFLQVVLTAPIAVLKRRKLERDGGEDLGPVFAVSPQERGMYQDNVKNVHELDSVLQFVGAIFPPQSSGESRYTREFWVQRLSERPERLLYARHGDVVCESVFACADSSGVTIAHCCVDEAYRGKGIGKALMLEAERRIKALGYHGIALGALEDAEGFYEKLGYTGSLLVQSEKHSVDELKSFNQKYEVLWTNVYDGKINQVCLRVRSADRELQRRYEQAFPGCSTQMVFGKRF